MQATPQVVYLPIGCLHFEHNRVYMNSLSLLAEIDSLITPVVNTIIDKINSLNLSNGLPDMKIRTLNHQRTNRAIVLYSSPIASKFSAGYGTKYNM